MRKVFMFITVATVGCILCCSCGNGTKSQPKSYLNQKAPVLEVDRWFTEAPNTHEKFVLLNFWNPAEEASQKAAENLNAIALEHSQFMVTALVAPKAKEGAEAQDLKNAYYFSSEDTDGSYVKAFNVKKYPYAVLMDLEGIVRWEGNPMADGHALTKEVVADIISQHVDSTLGGVKRTWAKPFRGMQAPKLVVKEWYNGEPDMQGKFVLVDYFGYHCPPCIEAVPIFNEWAERFKDEVVCIGYTKDGAKMLDRINPKITFPCAIDPKGETWEATQLHLRPYLMLIDPKGIVRWEGRFWDLTPEKIEELVNKYKA